MFYTNKNQLMDTESKSLIDWFLYDWNIIPIKHY